MKGRKPVPVEQRRLEGGSEVSHRPMVEPLLVAGRPDLEHFRTPPATLDPDAKEFWTDTVAKLVEAGIIDRIDAPNLEILATLWARVQMYRRVIQEKGLFAAGAAGQIKTAPWVKGETEAMAGFLKFSEQFALTPIARTRLGLAELHGRAMAAELERDLAPPGETVELDDAYVIDDGDVGLPGA